MYYRSPKAGMGWGGSELGEGQSSLPGPIPGPEPSGDREQGGQPLLLIGGWAEVTKVFSGFIRSNYFKRCKSKVGPSGGNPKVFI